MALSNSSFFIDYTNTHAALARADPSAAEHFGNAPKEWLKCLLDDCDIEPDIVLSGTCYVPKGTPEKHLSAFRDAGFTVEITHPSAVPARLSVDALTQDLADTVVVIGWLSTYTPLLEEIAADGGEKPIIVSFPLSATTSEPCKKSPFRAISGISAFEKSLGHTIQRSRANGTLPATRPSGLLLKMAAEIERDAQATGTLAARALPSLYKRFPDFATDSNWLGFRGLLPLTRAVLEAYAGPLEIQGEGNDWKILYSPAKDKTEATPSLSTAENDELLSEIYTWLGDHLSQQPEPVPAANAASLLADRFGEQLLDSGWLGHRSFRSFVQATKDPRISFSTAGPGYLFAPEIHTDPKETEGQDLFAIEEPELAPIAKALHTEHSIPYLSPESYAVLFRAISQELQSKPFNLGGTSKGARDLCPALGKAIPRSAINFILKSILTTPHLFGKGRDQAEILAAANISAISKLSPDTPAAILEQLFASKL